MRDHVNEELISAYLDNEVTDEERELVEKSLAESDECRQLFDELQSVQGSLQTLPRFSLPTDFADRVLREAERRQQPDPVPSVAASGSSTHYGWLKVAGAVVAIAGPTWKHEPSPFADDVAAIAIVVKVGPSMITEDVQPSRLARATEKIHDLLKERGAGKTSLIAYAGSAHVVMPATKDSGIIDTFALALDPKIMPVDGDVAAEALTLRVLANQGKGVVAIHVGVWRVVILRRMDG